MRTKNDFLQCLDPFLGTGRAICFKNVATFVGDDSEASNILGLLFVLGERSRDSVAQVDIPAREIEIRRIGIIG